MISFNSIRLNCCCHCRHHRCRRRRWTTKSVSYLMISLFGGIWRKWHLPVKANNVGEFHSGIFTIVKITIETIANTDGLSGKWNRKLWSGWVKNTPFSISFASHCIDTLQLTFRTMSQSSTLLLLLVMLLLVILMLRPSAPINNSKYNSRHNVEHKTIKLFTCATN